MINHFLETLVFIKFSVVRPIFSNQVKERDFPFPTLTPGSLKKREKLKKNRQIYKERKKLEGGAKG